MRLNPRDGGGHTSHGPTGVQQIHYTLLSLLDLDLAKLNGFGLV